MGAIPYTPPDPAVRGTLNLDVPQEVTIRTHRYSGGPGVRVLDIVLQFVIEREIPAPAPCQKSRSGTCHCIRWRP